MNFINIAIADKLRLRSSYSWELFTSIELKLRDVRAINIQSIKSNSKSNSNHLT